MRKRPIIVTTAAMVFGMPPLALALGLSEGGENPGADGRAIIGGVLTWTLLTLVVVPVPHSFLVRERMPTATTTDALLSAVTAEPRHRSRQRSATDRHRSASLPSKPGRDRVDL